MATIRNPYAAIRAIVRGACDADQLIAPIEWDCVDDEWHIAALGAATVLAELNSPDRQYLERFSKRIADHLETHV